MFNLFKSEVLRYLRWVLLLSTVMLLGISALLFAREAGTSSIAREVFDFVRAILYAFSAVFGVLQALLHKRPNNWISLIHRPLESWKIYVALASAGATIIFVVAVLPLLLVTVGQDVFTVAVVDTRQYAQMLYLLLTCYAFYSLSTFVVLSPCKGAFMLYGVLLFALFTSEPHSLLEQFLLPTILTAALIYLNLSSFKPNLDTHPQSVAYILLLGVPMSLALFVVLLVPKNLVYDIPKYISGSHPDNNPAEYSYEHFALSEDASDRMSYALEGATSPRATYFRKQAELADSNYIQILERSFPFRGQSNYQDDQVLFKNADSGVFWQFSHDIMLLEGRHSITNELFGFIGKSGYLDPATEISGDDRFDDVPVLVSNRLLVTKHSVYLIDFGLNQFELKHTARNGERYIDLPEQSENYISLVTNERIVLFDSKDFFEERGPAAEEYSVPHTVSYGHLDGCWTYRLVDGYSFLCMGEHFYGKGQPGVEVLHARLGGDVETIGSRAFTVYSDPAWDRVFFYALSPVLNYWVEPTRIKYNSLTQSFARNISTTAHWIIGFIHLASLVGGAFMCRLLRMPPLQTATWLLLIAGISVPALLSLFVMNSTSHIRDMRFPRTVMAVQ